MELLNFLHPVLEGLAGNHGFIAQIVMIIGAVRLFMKPLVVFLSQVVELTPTEVDNAILNKLYENKIYKAIVFILDWFLSVKLPKK